MARERDEFPKHLKDVLAFRVGDRCSNPSCRQRTHWAHSDFSKSVSLGVAAHITAAAEGGPRYDLELSSDDRCSLENAIWLCTRCAAVVDKDPASYPVPLLRKWKQEAELTPFDTSMHDTGLSGVLKIFKQNITFYEGVVRDAIGPWLPPAIKGVEWVTLKCKTSLGVFEYRVPGTLTARQFATAVGNKHFGRMLPSDSVSWRIVSLSGKRYRARMKLVDVARDADGFVQLIVEVSLGASAGPDSVEGFIREASRHYVGAWYKFVSLCSVIFNTRIIRFSGLRTMFGFILGTIGRPVALGANYYAYAYSEANIHADRSDRLTRMLEIIPSFLRGAMIADTIGWVMYRQGNYREARSIILSAARRRFSSSSPGDTLYHLYFCHRQVGELELAAIVRLWFISLQPKDDSVEKNRVLLDDDSWMPPLRPWEKKVAIEAE